jgi:hypothetical protein
LFCFISFRFGAWLVSFFYIGKSFDFDRGFGSQFRGDFVTCCQWCLDDSVLLLSRGISFIVIYWNRRLPKFRISVLINISNSNF